MNTIKSINLLTVLLLVVLINVSCSSPDVPAITETPPATVMKIALTLTPTLTPLPKTLLPATLTPSKTPLPPPATLTPLPTLTTADAKKLVRQLLADNAGCQLPCWWGITPGKTTWVEARHFLESFSIYVGETGGVSVPLPAPYSDATQMDHGYSIDRNGVVEFINIYNFNLAPNYYLPKFLETYGQPTEVWVRTYRQYEMGLHPFQIGLFYQDKGILIEYSTGHPLNEVDGKLQNCRLADMDSPFIYLWSPEKQNLSFDEAKQKFLELKWSPVPRPLLEATGMDVKTFYETFKNPETKVCLETDKNLWP